MSRVSDLEDLINRASNIKRAPAMTDQERENSFKGYDVIIAGLVAGLVTVALVPLEIRASHDANKIIHWPGFLMICIAIGAVLAVRDYTRKSNGLPAAVLNAAFETILIIIFAIVPLLTVVWI
jgi:hypothetical protein